MRRALAAAALLTAVSACGTTVTSAPPPLPSAGGPAGLAAPDDIAGAGEEVAGGGPQQVGAGSSVPATGSGPAGTGAGAPASGRPDGAAAPSRAPARSGGAVRPPGYRPGVPGVSHGVADDAITLGVVALRGGEAFANGLGFSISFGDAEKEFAAVIDDLNRRGGIHGRKVRTVVAYYDLGGAAVDAEAQQASICSAFTEDQQVFAALMPYNPSTSFLSCFAKQKTLLLNGSAASSDDVGLAQVAGWHYLPPLASYSRYPRTLVAELRRTGFLPAGAKAGILHIDQPQYERAVTTTMKPALEAAGAKVVSVAAVSTGGESASQINNAVLRFRADGVTHVFFVQAAGGLPLYFMQGAEQQGWYPRYGLSSFEVPGFFLQGNAPAAQLANAQGIGWAPFFDVKASEHPSSPPEKRCLEIVERGGERNAHRQSNLTVTPVCDLVWTFEAAARAAGPGLTYDSWRRGLQSLGSSFASPVALRSDFGSGRPDGAAGYRYVSWVAACSCFRYTGPLRAGLS